MRVCVWCSALKASTAQGVPCGNERVVKHLPRVVVWTQSPSWRSASLSVTQRPPVVADGTHAASSTPVSG